MKIKGICNGMVMQRGSDNYCEIYFTADEEITYIAIDDCYSNPKVEKLTNKYKLTGIVQGGPYTLMINEEVFENIYVGDVWLLTGQSNMQGIGRRVNIERNNNDCVRAYYMDSHWDVANHPLHELGKASHKVHTQKLNSKFNPYNIKGVGPGVDFAKKMYELTAVPQGIISCAHGGTNLFDQWDPKKLSLGSDESLYAATYDRFISNGGNCKGIFWYQGESDAVENEYKNYTDNMINLVNAFRTDFKADLPFVQVQIGRCSWAESENPISTKAWTSIREQQRKLNKIIDNFDTVNTLAYRLEDCIHFCADAQKVIGIDAAEAMYCLIYGELYHCKPGIKLRSMKIFQDDAFENGEPAYMSSIVIEYDNVHGSLQASGRAMGFSQAATPDIPDNGGIFDAYVDGNTVTVRCEYSKKDIIGRYLWYGFGRENSCNIVDSAGRAIPGFGPIQIKEGIIE